MKVLVSACLLGHNTKYNGKNNLNEKLISLNDKLEFVLMCPEVEGGLSIPRTPAEIKENKVINKDNIDVTNNYLKGANLALEKALKNNIKVAIVKEKSPSCGKNYIYDGTFTNTLIEGKGITTSLLAENGIKVFTENEIELFLEYVNQKF